MCTITNKYQHRKNGGGITAKLKQSRFHSSVIKFLIFIADKTNYLYIYILVQSKRIDDTLYIFRPVQRLCAQAVQLELH